MNNLLEKLTTILLVILLPIITILVFGWEFKSYSKLWGTSLEPLFIITNATTSYFLFSLKRWKIPALFLLLVTAFSTNQFDILHNVFAVGFFISCVYPLWRSKVFLYLYLGACLFALMGLFYFEMATTYVIAGFHLHSIYKFWKFKNRNYEHK